jgi:hypothetical protein
MRFVFKFYWVEKRIWKYKQIISKLSGTAIKNNSVTFSANIYYSNNHPCLEANQVAQIKQTSSST